jgi:hypothetical protein
VRLGERAGDVHISLHSSDPALTGRLSEGVHDLVGTLANAGYDAQAWSPGRDGQDRQNARQQQEEQRRSRRETQNDQDTGEFGVIMQQPIPSIS